jgi:hypothetical protein
MDSADARLRAARAYLATVPVLTEYAEQLVMNLDLNEQQRHRLTAALAARGERIEALHVGVMIRHLTAGEIEGLTDFQRSPLGRAIMRKLGAFQADLVPALTPLLRGVIEEALRAAPAGKSS